MGKNILAGSVSLKAAIAMAAFLSLGGSFSGCRKEKTETAPAGGRVKLGVEVFLESRLDLVSGKKVGLLTNPTGVDGRLCSVIDLLQSSGVELAALYGPEHGVRGNAQAGEGVAFYFDDKFNLPVFSLYGQSFKPEPGFFTRIDEYMRSRDTDASSAGKRPEGKTIRGLDVLIFDVQDVGTRVYTYVASMAYAMEACAEAGIGFIVRGTASIFWRNCCPFL